MQHSVTDGPILSFSACGPNSACRYSRPVCGPSIRWAVFMSKKTCWAVFIQLSNTTRYGPRIVWPMIGEMMIRPVEGPWILRPVEGPWTLRPVEGPWILRPVQRPMDPTTVEGPWIIQLVGGPWLQQFVSCHDYFGLVTKNRLLWPLEKHRKRTAVTTSKQLNNTMRK